MEINFFEEYPSEKSLALATQIPFPTKLYIRSANIEHFLQASEFLKKCTNVHTAIFWPALSKKSGYWISPFADTTELSSLFDSILNAHRSQKIFEVMFDLEYPLNKLILFQIVRNFKCFSTNKKLIESFFEKASKSGIKIIAIEKSHIPLSLLVFSGLMYKKYNHRISMYYSSFFRFFLPEKLADRLIRKKMKRAAKSGESFAIGLIAPGVYKHESTYSPKILEKELRFAKELGVREIIIYRLGGMNDQYFSVLNKFASK